MSNTEALAQQPAASGEPVAFDAEGFRAFVLRELPDDTIIGKGAWWADHLTKCAQWFVKPTAAPQPAPARVPLTDAQIEAIWTAHVLPGFGDRQKFYSPIIYARAIEAAHGITAPQGDAP